jgi:hypothetical protein
MEFIYYNYSHKFTRTYLRLLEVNESVENDELFSHIHRRNMCQTKQDSFILYLKSCFIVNAHLCFPSDTGRYNVGVTNTDSDWFYRSAGLAFAVYWTTDNSTYYLTRGPVPGECLYPVL